MRKTFLSTLMLFLMSVVVQAQNLPTGGKVISKTDGEPIIGATVVETQQPTNGTITDFDGNFQLTVRQGAELTVSYVGYKTVRVQARPDLQVTLEEDNEMLEEVVVTGYSAQKKADLTGSVAVVSTKALRTTSDADPMRALQGKVPGMTSPLTFVGHFDGKTFTCDTAPEVTRWMDYGKDHYATVSWNNAPEGRHTVIAWMSNWQYANGVPTRQFRSANSLPRDLELCHEVSGEYRLLTSPAIETEALRSDKVLRLGAFQAGRKPVVRRLPTDHQGVCEIDLELLPRKADVVTIVLGNAKGEETVMEYDCKAQTFTMDRTRSGLTEFSHDFPARTVAPAPTNESSARRLRLFVDRCSIEAFDGEGLFVMTNLVFPEEPYTTISVSADKGTCRVNQLTIYPLRTNP